MHWYHYSSNSDIQLKKYDQVTIPCGKPCGFWLSYNDEWLKWCEYEDFYTFNVNSYYTHEYSLDDLKLYSISSINDLCSFQEKYSLGNDFSIRINWDEVSSEYDGIIVKNFSQITDDLMNGETIEKLYCALRCKDVDEMNALITKKNGYFNYLWFTFFDISCACIWNAQKLSFVGKKHCKLNPRD